MQQQIFTVYDTKARAYLPPFFVPSNGMAQRTFTDACLDTTHQFGKHPEDYSLLHIGVFDDENATIETFESKINLGSGIDFIAVYERHMEALGKRQKRITDIEKTTEDNDNS